MKFFKIGLTIIFFLGLGALFLAVQRGYIIFQLPGNSGIRQLVNEQSDDQKRAVKLYLWIDGVLKVSQRELVIDRQQVDRAASTLCRAWLAQLFEEKVITEKVSLESAILASRSNELYLSFSHPFFPVAASIADRVNLIDGLLKTLRDGGVRVERCFFYVNHQPWVDDYLDFTQGWPISGFRAT